MCDIVVRTAEAAELHWHRPRELVRLGHIAAEADTHCQEVQAAADIQAVGHTAEVDTVQEPFVEVQGLLVGVVHTAVVDTAQGPLVEAQGLLVGLVHIAVVGIVQELQAAMAHTGAVGTAQELPLAVVAGPVASPQDSQASSASSLLGLEACSGPLLAPLQIESLVQR